MFYKKLYLYIGCFLLGLLLLIMGISIFGYLTEQEGIKPQLGIPSFKERGDAHGNGESHNTIHSRFEFPASHSREMTSQMRNLEKEQSHLSRKVVALESEMTALKGEIQSRMDEDDNMDLEN